MKVVLLLIVLVIIATVVVILRSRKRTTPKTSMKRAVEHRRYSQYPPKDNITASKTYEMKSRSNRRNDDDEGSVDFGYWDTDTNQEFHVSDPPARVETSYDQSTGSSSTSSYDQSTGSSSTSSD